MNPPRNITAQAEHATKAGKIEFDESDMLDAFAAGIDSTEKGKSFFVWIQNFKRKKKSRRRRINKT